MQEINPGSTVDLSLNNATSHARQKHEVEADMNVNSLKRQETSNSTADTKSSEYNIYGNVGTVQTGAHATANVIHNMGVEDNEALLSALEIVRNSIASMHELAETQIGELTEIVSESLSEFGKRHKAEISHIIIILRI